MILYFLQDSLLGLGELSDKIQTVSVDLKKTYVKVISSRAPTRSMLLIVTGWMMCYFSFLCFSLPLSLCSLTTPIGNKRMQLQVLPIVYVTNKGASSLLSSLTQWLSSISLVDRLSSWLDSAPGQNHIPSRCFKWMKLWPFCLSGCSNKCVQTVALYWCPPKQQIAITYVCTVNHSYF